MTKTRTAAALTALAALALLLAPGAMQAEADHNIKSQGVVTGEAAPDFTLTDTNGTEHSLSDFAGKTVILEWTNKTCPFVRKFYDEGHMQGWQQETTAGGDVVWLSIDSTNPNHGSFMDAGTWNGFIEQEGINSTAVLLDADGQVGKAYAAKTTPHIYIIDGEGTLRYQGAIDSIRSAKAKDIDKADNYIVNTLEALANGSEVSPDTTTAYGCSVKYRT
ncbi:MAG: redoxin domain-containing protein, partial [Planctomycetota bacterium]